MDMDRWNGRERKSTYTGLEFAEMLRKVSTKNERIYFTDIDFIGYSFNRENPILKLVLEVKRSYMILKHGTKLNEYASIDDIKNKNACKDYTVVNSDTIVMFIAENLKIPFIYVFYDENKVEDRDKVLIVWLPNYVNDLSYKNEGYKEYKLSICELIDKGLVKLVSIYDFKKFLRCLLKSSFEFCWQNL